MGRSVTRPPVVGIIANPASGKDLRRLVGAASVVDNNEKVNVVRRILSGLAASGVDRVLYMPEHYDIVGRALEGARHTLDASPLEMAATGRPTDTLEATSRLVAESAGCIVVLGGDGTSRLVATRCGETPLVAVSTGTNNALPSWIDGTAAGLAAGVVATRQVDISRCAPRAKALTIGVGSVSDLALVDVALSRERFVAARAIWEPDSLAELFLTRARPGAIGLSAIGAHLEPIAPEAPHGLWLRLGPGGVRVAAPIVPGVVRQVDVREWRRIAIGERVELEFGPGVVALDGEREHEVAPRSSLSVELRADGPRVVDIPGAIDLAARAGVFVSRPA